MKLYLFLFCFILGSCTSLPKTMRNANVTDVTYTQASQNIDNHKDVLVRWGGVIIDVENEENFSLVQALFYPLSYSGRPQPNKPSGGRFVIKSEEFLDPVVYAKDMEITVVGTLNGNIQRMVGKKAIQVPLIQSTAIHLWPKDQNSYYGHGPYYGGYGPYFGMYGPHAHPFLFRGGWGGGYYRPYWY
jgi:outer membrane lipoprotein